MAVDKISVLLVEDNPGDARLVRETLRDVASAQFDVTDLERLQDAIRRLGEEHFDVVLLDLRLPDSQGLDTFTQLHAQAPGVPVVVMTGLHDETIAVRAVEEGAQDYLVKGEVDGDRLARAIRYAIARHETQAQALHGLHRVKRGRVLGFWGAKGGVGTTTVALNVAAALQAKGKRAIALELQGAYGSFSAHLGGVPVANLSHLAQQINERELSGLLSASANGFQALFGPQKVEEFGEISPEVAGAVVDGLANMADYTIIDMGSHPSPAARAAAERCEFVVLVVALEPAWQQSARIALELLRSWAVPAERLGIAIVNKAGLFTSMNVREISSRMQCGVVGAIPSAADDMLSAQQRANPLVLCEPDSKASIGLRELADRLAADRVAPIPLPAE